MKKFLNSFKTRSFRVGGYSVFATLIVVAIVILVNVAVNALPKRFTEIDTSGFELFTLSEESKNLVQNLDKDITIYWLTTDPDESIGNLLDRYEGLSSHVKVVQIDPEENPTFISRYDRTYYSENSLIVDGGDRFRYVKNNDIYVTDYDYTDMEYYTIYGQYRSITSFDGEGAVTSAINYVVYGKINKVYCLKGHGESSLDNEYEAELKSENMELADLSLVSAGGVPDDCDLLLIHTPTGDLSAEDIEAVKAYLEKGGRMMLITSSEEQENQRPNLQAFMASYHVVEEPGFILEGNSNYYQSGYQFALLPSLRSHTITAPLKASNYHVVMLMASGLKVDAEEDLNEGETVTDLLRTSSDSYTKSVEAARESMEKKDGDMTGPFDVGVLIEQAVENDKTAKIVWFTSRSIADKQASELVSGGNEDLFINAMSYLTENESGISIHAKKLSKDATDYLHITNATATFWEIILIGAIPLLFLAAGIYIFVRRRTK